MENCFDVLVAGGGTAGVVAAIQAARAGYKTILIEKNALPGGTMTASAIAFPGLFYAWKKQIICGIGWELVCEAAAESGYALPEFEKQIGMTCHPQYQVKLNPLIYAALCDEKLAASGVTVLYHTMPGKIDLTDDGARVTVCTREGLKELRAARIIDCTGDAAAARLAGLEVVYPFPCQPATCSCRLSGYNFADLDLASIKDAARQAVEDGELLYTDLCWNKKEFNGHILKTYGNNANHIFPQEPVHTAAGRSALEKAGRASLLRAWRFLRRQKGLENLQMDMAAFECGVRESAVIQGEYTVTGEDYINAVKYSDAVCNAFYPIDLHNENGVEPKRLPEGAVPQVPLRALIPQGSRCLLAAGRIVSADRFANSALRVQAVCMATAQAAAAAACVSLQEGVPVGQLNVESVRKLLSRHDAILP